MASDPVAGRETRCMGQVVSKPRAGSIAFGMSSLRSRLVPTEAIFGIHSLWGFPELSSGNRAWLNCHYETQPLLEGGASHGRARPLGTRLQSRRSVLAQSVLLAGANEEEKSPRLLKWYFGIKSISGLWFLDSYQSGKINLYID